MRGKGGADEQPSAGLNAKVAGGSLGCERPATLAANGGHPTFELGVAKPANIQAIPLRQLREQTA